MSERSNTKTSTSRTMSQCRSSSRAWRPTSDSTTRSVPISPWAIGLRQRSIEPGLAEADNAEWTFPEPLAVGISKEVQAGVMSLAGGPTARGT